VKRDIDTIRKLTSRPFAINHIPQALDAEALTLLAPTGERMAFYEAGVPV
jgi:hypothetical protein